MSRSGEVFPRVPQKAYTGTTQAPNPEKAFINLAAPSAVYVLQWVRCEFLWMRVLKVTF